MLCMWCVSALEICRASSEIKPCMFVIQQYCCMFTLLFCL